MTIEITLGTVSTALAIAGTAGKIIHSLVNVALEKRDAKITELEGAHRAVRETQSILFGKLDTLHREHQDYRLHVAETYIGETKIEKLLLPVLQRLDNIERDLRGERADRARA